MSDKVRILFLATNPKDSSKLRLDEEIREIQSRIRAADFRDHFDLVSRWAVRPDDLLQAFNELRPHVVHFSGHGSKASQVVLEDKDGNAKPVEKSAMLALFRHVKDNIRLVVLNVCHSDNQAKAISDEIGCTIGMNQSVGDDAAITFASMFYGALAFGRSVGEAYEQGRTALMLNGIPEETTPTLLARPGVDAKGVFLVNRKPASPVLPPVAIEILLGAASSNTPINIGRYDGGLGVITGAKTFDCKFDLEQAALLEHAIDMLERVGWIRESRQDYYTVTHDGYTAAHRLQGQNSTFLETKKQMPELIAEMKKDLEGENGKFVREFFVMSRRHSLGGSEKPRFIYYEEDHENLRGMMDILENHGYIVDVTPKNVPIYRMTEEFVRLVLENS